MNTEMKVCRECGEAKPLDHFGSRKRNSDNLAHYCYPCNYARTHAAKERREAKMTPEERDAAWKAQLESGRKYNEANREKLARKRRAARMRAEVPEMVERLRWLYRARECNTDSWRKWAEEMKWVMYEKYNVYPLGMREPRDLAAERRMNADPVYAEVLKVKEYLSDLLLSMVPGAFDREIKKITDRLDTFDSREMHEALTHIPQKRDNSEKGITPSDLRILEKIADELYEKQQKREPLAVAKPFTLSEIFPMEREVTYRDGTTKVRGVEQYSRENPSWREFRLLQAQFGREFAPVYEDAHDYVEDDMCGLQNYLLRQQEEAEAAEQARLARNEYRRNYRAKQKADAAKAEKRRVDKAASARKRRAEGRRT